MSEYDIFTNIQLGVLNMDIENKIRLLNDCLTALNNIQKKQPKFKETITTFLNKNSCVLDSNSRELLKYELETFEIVGNEFLIENLQSAGKKRTGGAPGDENEQSLVTNTNSLTIPSNTTQPAQTTITIPPQPVSEIASIVSSLSTSTLSDSDKAKLLSQFLQIQQTNANANLATATASQTSAQTQLLIAETEKNNQLFVNNLIRGSIIFSYTAPAALVYYLNSTLNTVAVGTINLAGKLTSTVAGTAELTVRNAVPTILNTAISLGRTATDYMPTSVYTFLKETVSTVRSTGATGYASESYLSEKTQQLTSVGADVSTETIIIGCIIFYLALVLLLSILTSLIINLQTNKKFKMYIGFPGIGGISLGYGGKKTRKNRRKRNHKKSHHKKTYKK